MDRRQFLRTLNANGMAAVLPTSALANTNSSGISQMTMPLAAEVDGAVVEVTGTAWDKEPGVAELNLVKQRNGPTGTVKLVFIKNQTRFDNLARGGSDDF